MRAAIALSLVYLVGCSSSADPIGPTEKQIGVSHVPTYVAGVTAFRGDTSTFVQATQNDSTVLWVQVVLDGVVLSDVTTRIPDQALVASKAANWSLVTDGLAIVWTNSGAWVKQTAKTVSQGPAEQIAAGSISGVEIPANALAYLLIEN